MGCLGSKVEVPDPMAKYTPGDQIIRNDDFNDNESSCSSSSQTRVAPESLKMEDEGINKRCLYLGDRMVSGLDAIEERPELEDSISGSGSLGRRVEPTPKAGMTRKYSKSLLNEPVWPPDPHHAIGTTGVSEQGRPPDPAAETTGAAQPDTATESPKQLTTVSSKEEILEDYVEDDNDNNDEYGKGEDTEHTEEEMLMVKKLTTERTQIPDDDFRDDSGDEV